MALHWGADVTLFFCSVLTFMLDAIYCHRRAAAAAGCRWQVVAVGAGVASCRTRACMNDASSASLNCVKIKIVMMLLAKTKRFKYPHTKNLE